MRSNKLIIALAFLVLVLSFVLILFSVPTLSITCENQYGKCSDGIAKELEGINGVNIISARKKILLTVNNNFLVKNYHLSFKLPSKYVLNLVERKPVFALESNVEEKVALLDYEGKVLSLNQMTALPKLRIESKLPKAGETINNEELFSLRLILQLYYLFKIDRSEIGKDALYLTLADGNRAIFPLRGDRNVLVGSLILIMNKLSTDLNSEEKAALEGKENFTIDLRFKNPVIS